MSDRNILCQIEHISDIFTRMVLKTAAAGLAGNVADEITMAQFQALKHIALNGPSTVGSLAEGLSISQPAATMLVERMSRRGLVERQPGSSDRRRAEITLSGRAEELLARIESERAIKLEKTLALMEERERRQFMQSMESFVAAALKLDRSAEEACLRCGAEHQADCIVNQARLEFTGREAENKIENRTCGS